jgi:carbamate kinase
VRKAELFIKEGHFPPGSMRPKVEAAIRFVRNSGKKAMITSVEAIEAAVEGDAGTRITI